jgi:hypothetical protein
LALDSKGRVWSWGTNDKGQLGHSAQDASVKNLPTVVAKIRNLEICQIYCGEYIHAWGLNKNNCLLVNQPERGVIKTIVVEPMPVILPEYFVRTSRSNIVQNNQGGFDVYSASKPVKSESSRTQ